MRFAATFALLLPIAVAGQARASYDKQNGRPQSVEIVVYNLTKIPHEMVEPAIAHATEIFQVAGVRLEWSACTTEEADRARCGRQPGRRQIAMRLLGLPTNGNGVSSAETGGVAIRGTEGEANGYLTIYYERVRQVAARVRLDIPRALGHAMAHEIGHILLPKGSHATRGIMRERLEPADWRKAAMGSLLFDKKQAAAMRALLTARQEVAVESRTQ